MNENMRGENPSRKSRYFIIILMSLTVLIFNGCEEAEECEKIDELGEPGIETSILDGEWFRVGSNNPVNDNMFIEVENSQGLITDKANAPNFNVGDVKWKDITVLSDELFDYEELGSDGNYYSAVMELADDTTLLLSVGSSGAGNAQQWLRVGSVYINQETQVLDCSVSSPLVLVNGPAPVDYRVECVVDITSDLTIEPGVVIEFAENAGLGVYDGGTFKAEGTSEAPIVFKGEQNTTGFWRGIHIETRSVNNIIKHAEIRNAGSNYVYCCNDAATILLKGGLLALENLVIEDGGGNGIMAIEDAEFASFSNVTITGHDDYPVKAIANAIQYFGDSNSDFSGNTNDYIYVLDSDVTESITWKATNVPYLLSTKVLDVTAPLVIDAGTEIAVESDGGIGIYDNGSLKVTGSAAAPVIIRGKEALPGYWRGIHLETNSSNNDLDFLEVYDAGANYIYCCNDVASIFFKDGRCAVSNLTVGRSLNHGIIARQDFEFVDFTNVSVNSVMEPLSLSIERVDEIEAESDLTGGEGFNFIRIENSDLTTPVVFTNQNIPYLITGVIDITSNMTLQAGVEMTFDEHAGLGVYDNGSLSIEGTDAENVILSGKESIQGYWRGIHTETNTMDNSIDYARIMHAGSNYVYCCNDRAALLVKDGIMTITNSEISDNLGCGILVKPSATLTEAGNVFNNNAGGSICTD